MEKINKIWYLLLGVILTGVIIEVLDLNYVDGFFANVYEIIRLTFMVVGVCITLDKTVDINLK